jgi:acetyl-CoA carboxylase carboxyl transferase subunit alpha
VIDSIVPEPLGGAHRDPQAAIASLAMAIAAELQPLLAKSPQQLIRDRRAKYLAMGRTL